MIKNILQTSESFKRVFEGIANQNGPHSYLFHSSDEFSAVEIGKLTAQALICPQICDKCEKCLKFKNQHSDVQILPKEKGQLKVDDSNFIVEESFVKPIYFDKKIFIVQNVDNSTLEAQNKLLKVLEEPNKSVYYILTTSNLEKVLPTIKSRCFKVEVGKFDKNDIKKELQCFDDDVENVALSVGNGFLGKTIYLSKKRNLQEIFLLAKELVCKLKSSSDVLMYSKKIQSNKEDINLIFEIVCSILEDMILIKTQSKVELKLSFVKGELENIKSDYSLKAIIEIEKIINDAMKKLSFNTTQTLVIDNLLMKILEVKYLCR